MADAEEGRSPVSLIPALLPAARQGSGSPVQTVALHTLAILFHIQALEASGVRVLTPEAT
jgi:hypothetical protein